VNFSVYGRRAKGLSGISMFFWLTRILFNIARTSGSPDWTANTSSKCLHRAGVNMAG
jgi:hypothetical protein